MVVSVPEDSVTVCLPPRLVVVLVVIPVAPPTARMVVEPVVLPFALVRAEVDTADPLSVAEMVVEPVVVVMVLPPDVMTSVRAEVVIAPPAITPPEAEADADADA